MGASEPSGNGAASQKHATEMLATLRSILLWARGKRMMNHNPAEGVGAVPPNEETAFTRPNKAKPRGFTFTESARVASYLHVHHATVFWIQRLLGLRVSEVFGIRVGDLSTQGQWGLLHAHRQAGKRFVLRDRKTGADLPVTEKDATKTRSGDRLIVIPRPLLELIRVYIEAFHVDPSTGVIDPDARLIVGLRNDRVAGSGAYQTALSHALRTCGLSYEDLGFHASSHHLRKTLSTDVAFLTNVSEKVRSEILGHKIQAHDGGAAVTASAYTMSAPALAPLVDAAKEVERILVSELSSLFVPSAHTPLYSRDHRMSSEPWASQAANVLVQAGLVVPSDELVTVAQAASILGLPRERVAALVRTGEIRPAHTPTESAKGVRYLLNVRDVEAFQEKRESTLTVNEAAAEAGVLAWTIYRHIYAGRLAATQVGRSWQIQRCVFEAAKETLIVSAALHARSMTLVEAAEKLRVGYAGARSLVKRGELVRDLEAPGNVVYVTRESVDSLAARHSLKNPREVAETLTLPEAMRALGMNRAELLALVDSGVLKRVGGTKQVLLNAADIGALGGS